MDAPFRRIVTGHDAQGQAIIQEEGPPPRVQRIGGETGPIFYEVWNTRATPAPIDRASGEPPEDGIILAPPKNGTRIRVLDIPPEGDNFKDMTPGGGARPFRGGRRRRGLVLPGRRQIPPRLHAPHRDGRLRHRPRRARSC